MKKVLCLFFMLIIFRSAYCYQFQSYLQKNESEMFAHLKRRYPRKYNFKRNLNRLERDDFGYTPFSSR